MDSKDFAIRKEFFLAEENYPQTMQLVISHSLPTERESRSDSSRSELSAGLEVPDERDIISLPYTLTTSKHPSRLQNHLKTPRVNSWFDGRHYLKPDYYQTEETILAPPSTPYTPFKQESKLTRDTEESHDTEETALHDPIYFDALQAADKCLNELLRIYNSLKGWKVVSDRKGLKTEKCSIGNGDQVVKVNSKISCSAAYLLDFLKDVKNTQKWDSSCLEGFDLKSYTGDLKIIYIRYKQLKLIEDRDFIMTTKPYLLNDGLRVLVGKSVNLIQYSGSNSKAIRADIITSGFLIEERGNRACEVTYLAQVDPKGKIPRWLANKVTKYHTHRIKALRNHFRICYDKRKTIS